jgi:hypothetical protein
LCELSWDDEPQATAHAYLWQMLFEFCLPTKSTVVPDGPDSLHEVKYDG